ncbi:hypothetical protein Ddye_013404 [Dipteronia dyeriana]|uniref:Transposase MuDR plant domain-containing protein n=1 Tax=Dipteronia dyeriana TaxID=168575 RepID=A0AAE0CK65_9ROSI|nr:hypothetical protein Ddye_013404 [Dipteronia dyeriana]
MNRVRIIISYNGRREQLPYGNQRFLGTDNQGMYVSKSMTYQELVSIVETVVKYDVDKYSDDLLCISMVPETTCRTFIRNDDDVQFMLGEDRVIPQNSEQNVGPTQQMDDEEKLHPVDNVANNEEEEKAVEPERRATREQRFTYSATNVDGTSKVRPNLTTFDSDNVRTWVISRAQSYSFGIGGSRNSVQEEPTSMVYKGQCFPTKKDLKRLVGHFAMQQNFEWKVKRSNKTTLHLVCLMENYTWKFKAVRRDEGTYFQVRSFVNEHTCPLEEIHRRHRQVSAIIIGEVVTPRLQQQDGRLMCPKDIIADMKIITHEETFKLLPLFGYVLEQQNPGTITDLQYDEDVRFLYFFMSLGASLIGIQRCMGPVIAIDVPTDIADRVVLNPLLMRQAGHLGGGGGGEGDMLRLQKGQPLNHVEDVENQIIMLDDVIIHL